METENRDISNERLSLAEAFAGLPDPRVAGRSKHDLVEMLVVTMCALLCGVYDFVGNIRLTPRGVQGDDTSIEHQGIQLLLNRGQFIALACPVPSCPSDTPSSIA